MIFDSTNKFSTEQAVTTTTASTNIIDLGVAARDIGVGEVVPIWVGVDEAFAGLTSIKVTVQTSSAEGFGSPDDIIETGEVLLSNLSAGYQFAIQAAPKNLLKRFVRLNYTVTGTATAGTISAGVTMGNQSNG